MLIALSFFSVFDPPAQEINRSNVAIIQKHLENFFKELLPISKFPESLTEIED
jgi:hypothetical protein